ncbi:hypothetical protein KY285_029263 [Solanum tuberosum]|nr:hypothetical protein KY289_027731 [Solanum tuberosum]KAH0668057.1 hypothetical protein KY285_029263 [Solanum tuberosum]
MGREASLWLEVANDLSSLALGEHSMKVIQSSYDHLEDHLKPCLLYMGLFPEDYTLLVDDLLKLWMAEEYVLNAEKENMEEACRVFLSDLHNRSLVMVPDRVHGDVVYCSLHDVVREFCLRKLTEDKYMQLTVPYNPYQHLCSTESRLCIYIHDDLVKQLDHSDYQLDKIPALDFKETNSLEFIAHPKLNTWNNRYSNPLDLVVQSSKKLHLRAATLWEMTKLRHVDMECFSVVWKDNYEGSFEECSTTMLENMKTFHTYHVLFDNMNPRFWWRFPNLEELSLHVKYVPHDEFPLFPIPEVHILSVEFSVMNFQDSVGWERYYVFPSNLRHLHLANCFLTEEMVLNIVRLKKLEILTLRGGVRLMIFRSYCWDVTNVEFPALKYSEIPPSFVDIPTLRIIKLLDCMDCLHVSAMNIKREIEENTGCDRLQVTIS